MMTGIGAALAVCSTIAAALLHARSGRATGGVWGCGALAVAGAGLVVLDIAFLR